MKMENKFIINLTEDLVLEAKEMYEVKHSVVQSDIQDVYTVIRNAANAILLEGQGCGKSRMAEAIEDAVLQAKKVAGGYNLFTADRVLLHATYSNSHPIEMAEINEIFQLAELFLPNTSFVWSMSFEDFDENRLIVRIIASNIKKP